jgi:hypothetical protein
MDHHHARRLLREPALIRRYRERADPSAAEELLKLNTGRIGKIVGRYLHRRLPRAERLLPRRTDRLPPYGQEN